MINKEKNIIITGIPRSGTTLLTANIDAAPNSVALNEPRWQCDWAEKNSPTCGKVGFVKWLIGDFVEIRNKIYNQIPVSDRRLQDGSAVTNYYRESATSKEGKSIFHQVDLTRTMESYDFTLAIKHNALYLSVLEEIANSNFFKVFAIVREPVGVIASWNSVPVPLSKGRMPAAMMYWPEMKRLTHSDLPLLQKQVMIYDMLCERLHGLKNHVEIIRYEDYVRDKQGNEGVVPRKNSFYGNINEIREAVARFGKSYKLFYNGVE